MKQSTIVALSTPVGRGAISIVRLSGEDSKKYLDEVFRPYGGAPMLHGVLTLGEISVGEVRDKVMAVYFRAPKSYTGEDMVEVQCHGSPEISSRIIRAFISLGARGAEAGEFTRRAFLSGKLTLDEAEAVGDLISAQSQAGINSAFEAMQGRSGGEITSAYKDILSVLSGFEAAIDYPEEDVEEQAEEQARSVLESARERLSRLAKTFDDGEKIKYGVKVAIVGVPNAGKSSLLNRLLGRDRAIVTANAGTTRDTIEESYEYKGLLWTLIDTAGLRSATDEAEAQGVRRSEEVALSAHIVVRLIDSANPETVEVKTTGKVLDVYNKCDLARRDGAFSISAKTGEGVDELKEKLYELGKTQTDGTVITNARHFDLVCEAISALGRGLADLGHAPVDCVLVSLKNAMYALGKITGANATEDLLDEIFSKFCVGK